MSYRRSSSWPRIGLRHPPLASPPTVQVSGRHLVTSGSSSRFLHTGENDNINLIIYESTNKTDCYISGAPQRWVVLRSSIMYYGGFVLTMIRLGYDPSAIRVSGRSAGNPCLHPLHWDKAVKRFNTLDIRLDQNDISPNPEEGPLISLTALITGLENEERFSLLVSPVFTMDNLHLTILERLGRTPSVSERSAKIKNLRIERAGKEVFPGVDGECAMAGDLVTTLVCTPVWEES